MAHNLTKRVKNQSHKLAVMLMMEAEAVAVFPADLMNRIKAINLPGLACKEGEEENVKRIVACQALEFFYSCYYQESSVMNRRIGKIGCLTGTNFERLIQVPGKFTLYASMRHDTLDVVTLAKIRPIHSVHAALSWITLSSHLRNLSQSQDCELLKHNLRQAPKEGGYMKAHLLQRIFGPELLQFENIRDAINVPPRVTRDLIPVVARLKEIFASFLTPLPMPLWLHFKATITAITCLQKQTISGKMLSSCSRI
jgi:hypothetical protein